MLDSKTCKSCNITKSLDLFYKHPTGKDGYRNNCIKCNNDKRKIHYQENKVTIISKVREYTRNNKEKISKTKKEYRNLHKEDIQKYRDSHKQERKEYRIKNRSKIRKTKQEWLFKNLGYHNNYNKSRRKTDINFRLQDSLRHRLYMAIKGNSKVGSAVRDLGCSIPELKIYLESKFQPGMSWDNYGKWHIDHIVALSRFNLIDINQLKQAVHYTNLQPLWAFDNLSKGAK